MRLYTNEMAIKSAEKKTPLSDQFGKIQLFNPFERIISAYFWISMTMIKRPSVDLHHQWADSGLLSDVLRKPISYLAISRSIYWICPDAFLTPVISVDVLEIFYNLSYCTLTDAVIQAVSSLNL